MTAQEGHREHVYGKLVMAPIVGLLYVIALPFIAIGTVAAVMGKRLQRVFTMWWAIWCLLGGGQWRRTLRARRRRGREGKRNPPSEGRNKYRYS